AGGRPVVGRLLWGEGGVGVVRRVTSLVMGQGGRLLVVGWGVRCCGVECSLPGAGEGCGVVLAAGVLDRGFSRHGVSRF
ncbi:MAG TPA: hypothetical protein VN327_10110, partial [Pseudonocardiaceae bacterium]|nr:hypothetical protein [Pseudonocardiaceae bacterium]